MHWATRGVLQREDDEFVVSLERATGIKTNFVDGATAQAQIIAATNTYFDNKALTDEIAQGVFDKYVQ